MSTSKHRQQRRAASTTGRGSRAAIAAAVLLTVATAWTMLGYSGGLQTGSGRKATNVQSPSPASLNANSPSKEYVYAGARLVATESDFSIFPTYQSFPGNGGSSSISVSAPANANWTAVNGAPSFITITSGGSGTGNGTINYSVAVNSGSVIRSGTITVNYQVFTVYQGINFADVPSNYLFYDWIGMLAARGVTLGCGGGNFCPNDPVTQDQMSAFVIRALGMTDPPTPPSQRFADVSPPGCTPPCSPSVFYNFIDQMAVRGIWLGCGSGNYCPGATVHRDEMAAMMIRGRGEFNPPTPPSQRFYDVPPSNQYYNFIDRMAVLLITSGCGTACNTIGMPCYCPTDPVTRGQMAVFLVRAFNL